MNFADLSFWSVLFVAMAVVMAVRFCVCLIRPAAPVWFDPIGLAVLSMTLLWQVNFVTFGVFTFLMLLTYGVMWLSDRFERLKSWWFLALVMPLILAPLVFYKYAGFFSEDVMGRDIPMFQNLIIPVGISFYTFQKIALILDTRDRHLSLPRFIPYLNFAAFFPQIVAGPIERRADLLPQVEKFRFRLDAVNLWEGLRWIILGLFYKLVISDNLDGYIDHNAYATAWHVWLMNVLFGFKIYFDFGGYSLVALGVARCLGVRLTLNFSAPYISSGIQEFWRRWHITLSTWFRDYLYIPLGGSRTRRWPANLMIVFVVSGIWHGAGWNYIVWGAMHGAGCVGVHAWNRRRPIPAPAGWIMTMLLVFGAWLAFYETRADVLWRKYAMLFNPFAYRWTEFVSYLKGLGEGQLVVLAVLMAMCAGVIMLEWWSWRRHQDAYRMLRHPVVSAVLVILTIWLAAFKSNEFIYFSF